MVSLSPYENTRTRAFGLIVKIIQRHGFFSLAAAVLLHVLVTLIMFCEPLYS